MKIVSFLFLLCFLQFTSPIYSLAPVLLIKKLNEHKRKNVCSHYSPFTKKMKMTESDKPMDRMEIRYRCFLCKKDFNFNEGYLLEKHIGKHSAHCNEQKPYQCSFCKKRFSFIQNIECHIRQHRGDPFSQDLDDLVAVNDLKEKSYQCSSCDKKFQYESSFILHQRHHDQKDRFLCPYCQKEFCFSMSLCRHINAEHSHENAEVLSKSVDDSDLIFGDWSYRCFYKYWNKEFYDIESEDRDQFILFIRTLIEDVFHIDPSQNVSLEKKFCQTVLFDEISFDSITLEKEILQEIILLFCASSIMRQETKENKNQAYKLIAMKLYSQEYNDKTLKIFIESLKECYFEPLLLEKPVKKVNRETSEEGDQRGSSFDDFETDNYFMDIDHICLICEKSFPCEASYIFHKKGHMMSYFSTCSLCGKSFAYHLLFKLHVESHHPEKDEALAQICCDNNHNLEKPSFQNMYPYLEKYLNNNSCAIEIEDREALMTYIRNLIVEVFHVDPRHKGSLKKQFSKKIFFKDLTLISHEFNKQILKEIFLAISPQIMSHNFWKKRDKEYKTLAMKMYSQGLDDKTFQIFIEVIKELYFDEFLMEEPWNKIDMDIDMGIDMGECSQEYSRNA